MPASAKAVSSAWDGTIHDLEKWDGNIYDLKSIGQGGTSLVFVVNDRTVIKVPIPSPFGLRAIEQEREIYRRFRKQSDYVITCYNPEHRSGVLLEKCDGSVRGRLRQMRQGDNGYPMIGSEEAMAMAGRWAYQAAQGLAYIHSHEVVQADVGCHNMLLDRNNNLKLADFSGSSIINDATCPALVIYDFQSRLSDIDEPDKASDLFALGSAIYEMTTGHLPYQDLRPKQVQRLFFRKEFPDLAQLGKHAPAIAKAIRGCWHVKTRDGFKSAKQVVEELTCYSNADKTPPNNIITTDTKSHSKKRARSLATTRSSQSSRNRNHNGKKKRHNELDIDKRAEQHHSKMGYRSKRHHDKEPMKYSFLMRFFKSMRI